VRIGLPPRPSGLDDDGDLIVVAVNEPVEGHGGSIIRHPSLLVAGTVVRSALMRLQRPA
jgi:hypothetical protein